VVQNKVVSMMPWIHLLPNFLYTGIVRMTGESKAVIDELLEVKSTGISIERFERLVKKSGYTITNQTHFLINPIYQYKFGVKPRKQFGIISAIPFFRNFVTTCVYYLIKS
jgi:hypothetical protein